MMRFEFQLFADYHQFCIQDETADDNLSETWFPEAVGSMPRCTISSSSFGTSVWGPILTVSPARRALAGSAPTILLLLEEFMSTLVELGKAARCCAA
jgi:hypothetical protein